MANRKEQELRKLQEKLQKHHGVKHVIMANQIELLDVVPTGVLALDYALGIGGWPMGYATGLYGEPDVGKSSVLGLSAIANAQRLGHNCAIVLVERKFDPVWAAKLGVNPNDLLLVNPSDGRKAWDAFQEIIESRAVDFVIIDSLGAMQTESEQGLDGTHNQVGGQSKLHTWGIKRAAPVLYDNKVGAILINQVRDVMSMRGGQEQPGGWGVKHAEPITVQLRYKSGAGTTYKIGSGDNEVTIGRQLVAVVKMNQLAEGTGQRAVFSFYSKEVEGYPFGIDWLSDVIDTAVRLKVIELAGSYYSTPDGFRAQGRNAIVQHIQDNPKLVDEIRNGALAVMRATATKPKLEVVGDK